MAYDASEATFDICAVGNAIMDVLAPCDEAFLKCSAITKGSMTLIDEARARTLYLQAKDKVETAGGSVANTAAGVAALGGRPAYIGKIADDALGASFRSSMQGLGVHFTTRALSGGAGTAQCLIFVTPDAQRSMNTFLGACVELSPEDIDPQTIAATRVTYLEGYLFDKPKAKEAFRKAARLAHGAGKHVALSLSDSFCVERHREDFQAFVRDGVDILIGNEAEVKSLYRMSDLDAAMREARQQCAIVVGTRSEKGAVVASDGQAYSFPAEEVVPVVDTTGAGDLFASGFLFGLTHGLDLAASGRLGIVTASAILSHYGPRPKGDLKSYVRTKGIEIRS